MCWFIDLESLKRVFSHQLLFLQPPTAAMTCPSPDVEIAPKDWPTASSATSTCATPPSSTDTPIIFIRLAINHFLKVATTRPVDFLFHEPSFHLSHLKQMYYHLSTHELILCILIARGLVDFDVDTTVKSPCWRWALSLWPSDTDLLWFAPEPSFLFMAPNCRAHQFFTFRGLKCS